MCVCTRSAASPLCATERVKRKWHKHDAQAWAPRCVFFPFQLASKGPATVWELDTENLQVLFGESCTRAWYIITSRENRHKTTKPKWIWSHYFSILWEKHPGYEKYERHGRLVEVKGHGRSQNWELKLDGWHTFIISMHTKNKNNNNFYLQTEFNKFISFTRVSIFNITNNSKKILQMMLSSTI